MIVIPAVDIKDGKCVRLLQGRMDAETVFGDDPVAMACKWDAAGAEIIHIIDLEISICLLEGCQQGIGIGIFRQRNFIF